jgi:hypothetical protein
MGKYVSQDITIIVFAHTAYKEVRTIWGIFLYIELAKILLRCLCKD